MQRVVIESVQEYVFVATVVIAAGGESQEVDARPSDALNLAVRLGVPVFVASELMDQAAIASDKVPWIRSTSGGGGRRDATTSEWCSVTPELIASLQPRIKREFVERVLVWAREEARELGQDQVQPQHILLGLLRDPGDHTGRVLNALGITIELARTRARAEATGEARSADELALSAEAQAVLKLATLHASLGSYKVAAQHILLGLAHENALLDYGVTAERLGEEVRRAMRTQATNGG